MTKTTAVAGKGFGDTAVAQAGVGFIPRGFLAGRMFGLNVPMPMMPLPAGLEQMPMPALAPGRGTTGQPAAKIMTPVLVTPMPLTTPVTPQVDPSLLQQPLPVIPKKMVAPQPVLKPLPITGKVPLPQVPDTLKTPTKTLPEPEEFSFVSPGDPRNETNPIVSVEVLSAEPDWSLGEVSHILSDPMLVPAPQPQFTLASTAQPSVELGSVRNAFVSEISVAVRRNSDDLRFSFESKTLPGVSVEITRDRATGELNIMLSAKSAEVAARMNTYVPQIMASMKAQGIPVRTVSAERRSSSSSSSGGRSGSSSSSGKGKRG